MFADGLNRCLRLCRSTDDVHTRSKSIEFILDLLARVLRGATHQHLASQACDRGAIGKALLIAVMEAYRGNDSRAAGFLRQKRKLHPSRQLASLRPRLDIGEIGIE